MKFGDWTVSYRIGRVGTYFDHFPCGHAVLVVRGQTIGDLLTVAVGHECPAPGMCSAECPEGCAR